MQIKTAWWGRHKDSFEHSNKVPESMAHTASGCLNAAGSSMENWLKKNKRGVWGFPRKGFHWFRHEIKKKWMNVTANMYRKTWIWEWFWKGIDNTGIPVILYVWRKMRQHWGFKSGQWWLWHWWPNDEKENWAAVGKWGMTYVCWAEGTDGESTNKHLVKQLETQAWILTESGTKWIENLHPVSCNWNIEVDELSKW